MVSRGDEDMWTTENAAYGDLVGSIYIYIYI
jgi:hypothetical protein